MQPTDWAELKHFTPDEKWGEPGGMNYRLLWMLDEIRDRINQPFIIHCGYELTGHVPFSYHHEGQAVDFHVKGVELQAVWEVLHVLWWFGGCGVYPHWNNPGFHLDIGQRDRRWYRNAEGKYLKIINGVFEKCYE